MDSEGSKEGGARVRDVPAPFAVSLLSPLNGQCLPPEPGGPAKPLGLHTERKRKIQNKILRQNFRRGFGAKKRKAAFLLREEF